MLSRLRDAEVTVYRTDLHGDITVAFDGEAWSVTTAKTASKADIFTPGVDTNFAPDTGDSSDDVTRGDGGDNGNEDSSNITGMDYIANKNTKKFHYPDCKSVKQMSDKNKQFFYDVTRDYMIEQGYDPCGNCDP